MLPVASTPTSEMQGLLWNSDEMKMSLLPCIAAKHTVEPCGQPRPVDESGGSRAAIDASHDYVSDRPGHLNVEDMSTRSFSQNMTS